MRACTVLPCTVPACTVRACAVRACGVRRATCLVIALRAAACGARRTAPRDVIVVALANSPVNLDPAIGTDEASQKMHQLLFSSLLKIDGTLRVVPDLATRFETADHQTYVAEIPPGVRFHDGREMTAEDVAFTFRRFLDPAFTSGRKGAYRALNGVDVVGALGQDQRRGRAA